MTTSPTLPIVRLDAWTFIWHVQHPRQGPEYVQEYPTALKLLLAISDPSAELARIQGRIQERLRKDVNRLAWHSQRTFLKNAPHFQKYRRQHSVHYHEAARLAASGTKLTQEQSALLQGLNAEINASKILLPVGQKLFHGTLNQSLTSQKKCPTFISTSLDPIVAFNHSKKRAFQKQNCQACVYLLTVQRAIPAFYGQAGCTAEFELLLPTGLEITETNRYQIEKCDVIEADVV